MVDGGDYVSLTDSNGRYKFRSVYTSVSAHVRPSDGYEPKPRGGYGGFELVPGQDITIRRIVRVSMSPPATMGISRDQIWTTVGVSVEFDTGMDQPYWDDFVIGSSDVSVVRGRVQYSTGYLEGVKLGTAEAWGSYHGVQSARHTVQVVQR